MRPNWIAPSKQIKASEFQCGICPRSRLFLRPPTQFSCVPRKGCVILSRFRKLLSASNNQGTPNWAAEISSDPCLVLAVWTPRLTWQRLQYNWDLPIGGEALPEFLMSPILADGLAHVVGHICLTNSPARIPTDRNPKTTNTINRRPPRTSISSRARSANLPHQPGAFFVAPNSFRGGYRPQIRTRIGSPGPLPFQP